MPMSNPFAPSPANRNQPASAQTSPPSITLSSPPSHPAFDSSDLEEPPPYTPSASITSGETTVEIGPARPFQSTQPPQSPPRNSASHGRIPSSSFPSHSSSSSLPVHHHPSHRSPSAVQQLSDSFIDIVNHLSAISVESRNNGRAASAPSTAPSNNWSSYPGQNPRAPSPLSNPAPRSTHSLVPPPQHPQSSSHPSSSTSTHSLPSMSSHSDFARDFYAAGSGSGENLLADAPATQFVPNDGRPTSQPQPGHPLLKDGKLLVYTKGFECKKCHNMGYIGGNPKKPCNHCWKKYAKPFSGPLVYSFPADTDSPVASNLQKPLPRNLQSAPPVASSSAPQPARLTRNNPGRQPSSCQGGFSNPPTAPARPVPPMRFTPPVSPPTAPVPAGSSVTYFAGDPRIGGQLCWKCGGQGSFELFIFRETCPRCSGIGRVFN